MKKKILVAVAWPYVNGDLHVGHLAGYLLPADMFARFHRLIGNDVLMVSGSDCYGTPITLEADKRGVKPEDIIEEYHAKDVALFAQYGFSYDLYTKTTNPVHTRVVQDMFVKLLDAGYIFTDTSKQYYSKTEQRFLPDRYVEGTCPVCGFEQARSDQCDHCSSVLEQGELKNPHSKLTGSPVTFKETEHYFLDWPKLQPKLEAFVSKSGVNWKPWVLAETKQWLGKGLQPRAITRDLDWGVEIPVDKIPEDKRIEGCDHKRIYVWFDAVIGYLSASQQWAELQGSSLQEQWKDWWFNPDAQHSYFMGKDNLVFHTLFWPGQLMGAYGDSIHLPDYPSINQFLTLEGQKFSKSRGLTINSKYLADTYGADAIRFYLCSIMPESADASFSWADFVQKHNNLLIGNLGNYINRTLTLSKELDFSTGVNIDAQIKEQVSVLITQAKQALLNREFKQYWEIVLKLSSLGNEYLNQTEPWRHKAEPDVYKNSLCTAMYITVALTLAIKPLMPVTSEIVASMLSITCNTWNDDVDEQLTKILGAVHIQDITPLFTKLDEQAVLELENAKLPTLRP